MILKVKLIWNNIFFQSLSKYSKVQIFWEGHTFFKNLPTFLTLISNFKKRTLWPPYNVWTLKSTFIAPSLSSLTLFMKKSFHWSALCHTGHLTFLSQSWFFFYFLQTLHWYIFFSSMPTIKQLRKAVYKLGSLFPKLYESLKNRHKSW